MPSHKGISNNYQFPIITNFQFIGHLIFEIRNLKFVSALCFVTTLIILLSVTHISSPTFAQTTNALEKAQKDYTFQFTKYRDAQEKYINAKSEYESFKTATAKNDAFNKTKDYLTQINKLYLTYIALIQENGNAINFSAHGDDKNKSDSILKGETGFFSEENKKIGSTKTLEELPPIAKEVKTHVAEEMTPKSDKVLAIYEVVQSEAALEDFKSLSRILDRVVVFKLRAGETKSILNNWSSEIKDIQAKTEASTTQAREELGKTQDDRTTDGELNNIAEITKGAKAELKRSQPLFEEVARII